MTTATALRKTTSQPRTLKLLLRLLLTLGALVFLGLGAGFAALRMWESRCCRQSEQLARTLGEFQLGTTSKSQALSKLPALLLTRRGEDGVETYEAVMENRSQFGEFLRHSANDRGEGARSAAYLYGVRHWWFSMRVEFKNDVVENVAYAVRVSSRQADDPEYIFVNVGSLGSFDGVPTSPVATQSPDYRVSRYAEWPQQELTVAFTSRASKVFLQHAFALRMECFSSFAGCSSADQLLPASAADLETFKAAAAK